MDLFRRCVFSPTGRFLYYIFDNFAIVMYNTLTNSAVLLRDDRLKPKNSTSASKLAYVNESVLLVQHEKSVFLIQLNFKTLTAHRFQIYNFIFIRKYINDDLNSHTNLLVRFAANFIHK